MYIPFEKYKSSYIEGDMKMARKDFGAKPYSYPQAVFMVATYGADGTVDVMNAAWGGISDTTELTLCLSKGHKTVANLLEKKAFTVSMGDAAHVAECDYLGIVSGNNTPDKFAKSGFTATKSEKIDAPIINELPVCIECALKSYDPSCGRLVADIVNVSVDEAYLREDGSVDTEKCAPISFDPFNNAYYVLGAKVGNAFADGKKLK